MTAEILIPVKGKVHLSEVRLGDKAAFVRHLNDEGIHRSTLRIPFPYTAGDADKFLALSAKATAVDGYPLHFAVRGSDDQLIGCCGFEGLVFGHRAEIGYWLARPYWGQGIMTDVVGSACAFALEKWNLVRISAEVFELNQASARVLEKNGFVFEGLLRKYQRKGGEFVNTKLYALVT